MFVIDNKVGSGVLVKAVAVDKGQFDVAIIVGAFVVTSRAARLIRQRNVNIQIAVDDVLLILRRNAVGVSGDCDLHPAVSVVNIFRQIAANALFVIFIDDCRENAVGNDKGFRTRFHIVCPHRNFVISVPLVDFFLFGFGQHLVLISVVFGAGRLFIAIKLVAAEVIRRADCAR